MADRIAKGLASNPARNHEWTRQRLEDFKKLQAKMDSEGVKKLNKIKKLKPAPQKKRPSRRKPKRPA